MNHDKHPWLSRVSKFLHSGERYSGLASDFSTVFLKYISAKTSHASHFSSSSSLTKLPSFTFWGLSLRPYFEEALLDNLLNTHFYFNGRSRYCRLFLLFGVFWLLNKVNSKCALRETKTHYQTPKTHSPYIVSTNIAMTTRAKYWPTRHCSLPVR